MATLGDRIRRARINKGLTLGQLGAQAGGLRYQTIQNLENGKSSGSKHIVAIARVLGVSADWLVTGLGPIAAVEGSFDTKSPNHGDTVATTLGAPHNLGWPKDLKVLSLGGIDSHGYAAFTGEVMEMTARPVFLTGIPQAYAVYIVDSTMEPRYFPGEMAYIHPGRPALVGDFAVVQVKNPEGGTPGAVIRRITKRSETRITLEQYEPHKTTELKMADVAAIHPIVGSGKP